MDRNTKKTTGRKPVRPANSPAAKRAQHHRGRRRKRRQNSLLPAILFTLGMLAVIALAVKLLPKPAANVPAASEVQARAQVGVETAELRGAEEAPVMSFCSRARWERKSLLDGSNSILNDKGSP